MTVAGIIAEYDPFHRGHAWQIEATRAALGEEAAVVVVQSGNWVQRGRCALTDKWTRAELALRGGADLIIELPTPWAMATAERFAQGATALLRATGVVDTLSFGSESGDSAALERLAQALTGEEFSRLLREKLASGAAFPVCRQQAAAQLVGEELAQALARPNDNLGVEYLKALRQGDSSIRPLAIPRRGVDHHSRDTAEGFASATHIRALLRSGDWEGARPLVPEGTVELLRERGCTDLSHCERAILAQLRRMTEADFATLPDSGAGEGLPARLCRCARQAGSLAEFYDLAKTKRYSHARLRRLVLSAWLGLREADRPESPPYLRVLGFTRRGRELLGEMKYRATLPIVTRLAQGEGAGPAARALLEQEERLTDLYALCYETPRPCGWERTGQIVKG